MSERRWLYPGLIALVLVCFGHAVHCDLIAFDHGIFANNPQVRAGLSWAAVRWAATDATATSGYWVPLTWLSLQLDATLFRGAWGFHLTNLLLHVGTVVLLYWVLREMTGNAPASALAAAVFGIHPLRVETVAWVAERKGVLCGLFLVATMAAYVHYARAPSWRRYA